MGGNIQDHLMGIVVWPAPGAQQATGDGSDGMLCSIGTTRILFVVLPSALPPNYVNLRFAASLHPAFLATRTHQAALPTRCNIPRDVLVQLVREQRTFRKGRAYLFLLRRRVPADAHLPRRGNLQDPEARSPPWSFI